MTAKLLQLRTFLEKQIKDYPQVNHIEIQFGKNVSDNIFRTIYQDNNECEFAKLVKHFRNFKLSYSQGKIYKYNDMSLKTFNNKYNVLCKGRLLEKIVLLDTNYDMLVSNNKIDIIDEFIIKKNYNEEAEYDEINIHLSQDSNDQLLIFQKKGDFQVLKMELKLDINLPYTYLDSLMEDIEKVLKILESQELTF